MLELGPDEVAVVVVLLGLRGEELEGLLDLGGHRGGDGQVVAGGAVAVLVGDPVDGVEDAVRAGVREGALLGGHGTLLGLDVLDGALLGGGDAVLGLVAARRTAQDWVGLVQHGEPKIRCSMLRSTGRAVEKMSKRCRCR